MIQVTVNISTYYVGCGGETSFNIDKEEWDNMSEDEQSEMCWEYAKDLVHWNYSVEEI